MKRLTSQSRGHHNMGHKNQNALKGAKEARHIGKDLGRNQSQVCIRTEAGKFIHRRIATSRRQLEKVKRPRFSYLDRGLWVLLRRFWTDWAKVLVIVKPDTVVRWHRAG